MHPDDEHTCHSPLISVDQNTLVMLVEQCGALEQEMCTLNIKTDKILKVALSSVKNEQVVSFFLNTEREGE